MDINSRYQGERAGAHLNDLNAHDCDDGVECDHL